MTERESHQEGANPFHQDQAGPERFSAGCRCKARKTLQGFWANDKSVETQKILLDMSLL